MIFYFTAVFYNNSVLLNRRFGGRFQQLPLFFDGSFLCCNNFWGFIKPFFAERLKQVIYCMCFKGLYGIFFKSGREYNGRGFSTSSSISKAIDLRHLDIEEYNIGLMQRL